MARKISLCGFAEGRQAAPWTDESWEKWCCNDLYFHIGPQFQLPNGVFPRGAVTRVFEIHHLLNMGARRNPAHEQWMKEQAPKLGIPVYMQEAREEYPTSVAYPRQDVVELFGSEHLGGTPGANYVTNSISWMIALALMETSQWVKVGDRKVRLCEEGTEIALYGIQMAGESDEYTFQRPSVEYWLGVCKGMGAKLVIPDDCELLKTTSEYGYDTSHPLRVRLEALLQNLSGKTIQLQQQEAQLVAQLEQTRQNLAFIRGAKDAYKAIKGRWTNPLEIGVGQEVSLEEQAARRFPNQPQQILLLQQPTDGQVQVQTGG